MGDSFSNLFNAGEKPRFTELSLYEEALREAYLANRRHELEEMNYLEKFPHESYKQRFREMKDSIGKEELKKFVESFGSKEKTSNCFLDSLVYHYAFNKDMNTALDKTLDDRDNLKAYEEINSSENIDIGMEYEIPSRFGQDIYLPDIGRYAYDWRLSNGEKAFSQEDSPRTVEIKSDVHEGIYSMALEIDRRLEIIEKFSKNDILFSDDSSEYSINFPGMHFRLGMGDMGIEEFYKVRSSIYFDLPAMGFLSANGPGNFRSDYSVSQRQMKNIDFKSEHHVVPDKRRNCIEYRIPDVHRDKNHISAIAAMFLGVQNYWKDNYGKEDMDGSLEVYEEKWKKSITEDGLKESELEKFLERVSEGLEKSGISPGSYVEILEENYRKNKERLNPSSLETKTYPG